MIEIRNVLEENNLLFSDKNLSWGASVNVQMKQTD